MSSDPRGGEGPRSAELSLRIAGLESEGGFGSSNFLRETRARDRDFRGERPEERRGIARSRTEKREVGRKSGEVGRRNGRRELRGDEDVGRRGNLEPAEVI